MKRLSVRPDEIVREIEGSLPFENDVPGEQSPEYEVPHLEFRFVELQDGTIGRIVVADANAVRTARQAHIEEGGKDSEFLRTHETARQKAIEEMRSGLGVEVSP